MNPFELTADIADPAAYRVAVAHLRARGIALPSFGELAQPRTHAGRPQRRPRRWPTRPPRPTRAICSACTGTMRR